MRTTEVRPQQHVSNSNAVYARHAALLAMAGAVVHTLVLLAGFVAFQLWLGKFQPPTEYWWRFGLESTLWYIASYPHAFLYAALLLWLYQMARSGSAKHPAAFNLALGFLSAFVCLCALWAMEVFFSSYLNAKVQLSMSLVYLALTLLIIHALNHPAIAREKQQGSKPVEISSTVAHLCCAVLVAIWVTLPLQSILSSLFTDTLRWVLLDMDAQRLLWHLKFDVGFGLLMQLASTLLPIVTIATLAFIFSTRFNDSNRCPQRPLTVIVQLLLLYAGGFIACVVITLIGFLIFYMFESSAFRFVLLFALSILSLLAIVQRVQGWLLRTLLVIFILAVAVVPVSIEMNTQSFSYQHDEFFLLATLLTMSLLLLWTFACIVQWVAKVRASTEDAFKLSGKPEG